MRRLMIISLLLIAISAFARTIDDTYHMGSAVFAGDFYDVLYHNGYVWIADGEQVYSGNVKIMDVSDPENPFVAAHISYTDGSAFRLDAEGDLLFVSVKGHGVKIYNVSAPLFPLFVGEYTATETINDMDVLGDLLCVLGTQTGLSILNIINLSNIQTLSQTAISGSRYSLAVTSDSLLSVASGATGLQIFTIADPVAPRLLDTVTLDQKTFHDVVCNDTHAYAVYRRTMINSGGFAVIDISNPPNFTVLAQPITFGVDPFPDNGLYLAGDTLFFAATQGGFGVWNISEPENPSRYGGWGGAALPGIVARWSTRCTFGGGFAYNISPDRLLTDTKNEACVFDLSDLTDPHPIGFYDVTDWVKDAVGSGDYAYVASGSDGLLVVDISDLENPVIVGGEEQHFINLSGSSVLYENGYAYVSGGWVALKIFDVINPENPTVVSTVNEGWASYRDMDKQDSLIAVVGTGISPSPPGWLSIINVTDVASPQWMGYINLDVGVHGIDLVDTLAFIGYADGLGVLDISIPNNPVLISSYDTGEGGQDVVVRDNIAFVADQSNGLVILDVSDPFDPRPISSLDTPGWAMEFELVGDSIYVADSTALVIIDVSDLQNPAVADIVPVLGFAQGISVDDGRIFLCDNYGFHIYTHEWLGIAETGGISQMPVAFNVNCHPNPFNPITAISFQLSAVGYVNLAVYDAQGRQVAELINGWRNAGVHEVTFDASNLASGLYIYRLQADDFTATGKMVLMK